MARMASVVIPGIPHHITQRGNRRQPIFSAIRINVIIKPSVVIPGISIFAKGGRVICGRAGFHHFLWTIIIFIQRPGILS